MRFLSCNVRNIFLCCVLVLSFLFGEFAFASVEIIQINCNPVGKDSDYEWIKIKNISTTTVDLSGWSIIDSGVRKDILFAQELDPEEEAYIARNKDKLNFDQKIFQANFSLSNKEDEIAIADSGENIVDKKSYSFSSSVKEGEYCYPYKKENENTSSDNTTMNVEDYKVVFKTVTIQPKPELKLVLNAPTTTTLGAKTEINAHAYNSKGEIVRADFVINTGDGKLYNTSKFFHIYKHPGKYLIYAKASKNGLYDSKKIVINVIENDLKLFANKEKAYIYNISTTTANISGYKLYASYRKKVFPENTYILPEQVFVVDLFDEFGKKFGQKDKFILKDARNSVVSEAYVDKNFDMQNAISINDDNNSSSVSQTNNNNFSNNNSSTAKLNTHTIKVSNKNYGKPYSINTETITNKGIKNTTINNTTSVKYKGGESKNTRNTNMYKQATSANVNNSMQNIDNGGFINWVAGFVFATLASVIYVLLG